MTEPFEQPQDPGPVAPAGGDEQTPVLSSVPAEQGLGDVAPDFGGTGLPAPPPRRRIPVAAIVAAVVVLLGVAAVVLWQTGVLSLLFGGPAAATIAPANADLYVSINMNLESLPGYKHLADVYGEVPAIKEAIDSARSGMEEQGLSFDDDIRPWIGREVGIAVTDMGPSPEGGTPGVAVIAASRDARAADAFLVKLQGMLKEQGQQVEQKDFAGVTYYQATPSSGTPLFFGPVKGFVVLATSESAMQGVVNVAQGKADALAQSAPYNDIRKLLPAGAAGYFVFPNAQTLMDSYLEPGEVNVLAGGVVAQAEAYESFGAAVVLEDDGVRVEFAAKLDPKALPPEVQATLQGEPSAGRILKWIPADAMVFISTQDLAGAWKNILATLKQTPEAEQQIQEAGDSLGLAIDEELFNWAQGEYAAVVLPLAGDPGVGLLAVLEVGDQPKAADVLGKIATAIEESAGTSFQDRAIGDNPVRELVDPSSGQTMGSYGFADEHLFVGVLGPVLDKIISGDFASMTDDETFRKVQEHLPARRTGTMYVAVAALWQLISQAAGPDESASVLLGPIKAFGAAGAPYDSRTGVGRATLFVYIP